MPMVKKVSRFRFDRRACIQQRQIERRTPNVQESEDSDIERRILMALRFIYFRQANRSL
jgi:hypothetical protein